MSVDVRLISAHLSVVVLVVSGAVGLRPADARAAEPAVIVQSASGAQRARLADAMTRFGASGLRLPDFEIAFREDESACSGHLGAFRRVHALSHIDVCSDLDFVVLHELAHVWIDANVDDAASDRYIRVRGLTAWTSPTLPWQERGVEDAAFIIQQNLRDVAPSVLSSATWRERIGAFELLTGRRSPLQPCADIRNAGQPATPLATTTSPPLNTVTGPSSLTTNTVAVSWSWL